MSIIVNGMKMPEDCHECPFENYHSDIGQTVCMASLRVLATGFKTISFDGRHCSCPLVALPDKHGRLVDVNEIIVSQEECNNTSSCQECRMRVSCCEDIKDVLEKASTIIEAEDNS